MVLPRPCKVYLRSADSLHKGVKTLHISTKGPQDAMAILNSIYTPEILGQPEETKVDQTSHFNVNI